MQLTFKSGLYSRAAYTYTDTVFDIISIFEGKNSHLYYLDLKLDSSFDLRAKQAMMGPSLRGFAHAAVPCRDNIKWPQLCCYDYHVYIVKANVVL